MVWDHYGKKPFTREELEKANEKYRLRYEKGENITKAYGTSLIAAAITPHYWFGFHIGDGRLTALYPDGTFDQPVPWDPKCYLNVTSSLCDEDVLTRDFGVRAFLSFNAERAPPLAVFLCTDGVDDNYPVDENEKHLFKLFRTVGLTFAESGFDSTKEQLLGLANAFATKGKGDDTSIAGFINMDALENAVPIWQKQAAAEDAEKARAAEESAKARAAAEEAEKARAAAKEEAEKARAAAEEAAKARAAAEEAAKARAAAEAAAKCEPGGTVRIPEMIIEKDGTIRIPSHEVGIGEIEKIRSVMDNLAASAGSGNPQEYGNFEKGKA